MSDCIASRVGLAIVLSMCAVSTCVLAENAPATNSLGMRLVAIGPGLEMGQREVTVGQFLVFYNESHYSLQNERDGRLMWGYRDGRLIQSPDFRPWSPGWPVGVDNAANYVSWADAIAFCEWLSKKEGQTYRLPTLAEWEAACRPNAIGVVASSCPANRFGLAVPGGPWREWCSDPCVEPSYARSPLDTPEDSATTSPFVARAGGDSLYPTPGLLPRARRDVGVPTDPRINFGFRVVRVR